VSWHPSRPEGGSEPRPIGPGLDRVLGRLGSPDLGALTVIFSKWEAVVGTQVAAHTHPLSVRDGTLVLAVDNPAWATQLRFLTDTLLARLAAACGPDAVMAIEVRVRPPKPRS